MSMESLFYLYLFIMIIIIYFLIGDRYFKVFFLISRYCLAFSKNENET